MSHNFSLKIFKGRNIFLILFLIIGLATSKALVSIISGAILANVILSYKEHQFKFINKTNLPILTTILYFACILMYAVFTTTPATFFKETLKYAPWLIFPFAISALKKSSKNYYYFFIGFLIFIISIVSVVVLSNYFIHFDYYLDAISRGKSIATPHDHIRFTLLISFSALASIYFAFMEKPMLSKWDNPFFITSATLAIISLHILSVRTGVVTFYVGFIFLILYYAIRHKKWILIPLFSILLGVIPFLAYHYIPSFKNKIDYMKYDWQQVNTSNINWNSDTKRVLSYKVGIALIKERPFIGHGLARGEKVCKDFYVEHYPTLTEKNQILPHNQFLFTALELGVLGLSILIFVLLIPFIYGFKYENPLLIVVSIILISSCFVENNLESQVALTFYLLFSSLLLKMSIDE